jgi:hypothetical protein
MKSTDFKKIIKEAVKEAIQEELKDILLEAIKLPKQVVKESYTPPARTPEPSFNQPTMDLRAKYADVLGETALSFTTSDLNKFNPTGVTDLVNGSLPSGEIGMDQIMNLMNK